MLGGKQRTVGLGVHGVGVRVWAKKRLAGGHAPKGDWSGRAGYPGGFTAQGFRFGQNNVQQGDMPRR